MKQPQNDINKDDLRRTWKASDNIIDKKYKLTTHEMEQILIKEGTSMFKKFRASIIFDIILKSILCSGLFVIWLMYPLNLLVASSSLLLILFNVLLVIKLAGIVKTSHKSSDFSRSTVEILESSIDYHQEKSIFIPVSWGLSAGTFFMLGSYIYHHFKYGMINPFRDFQDIVVFCAFMIMAIVLAFISNHFTVSFRFRHLKNLVDDLNNESEFISTRNKLSRTKYRHFLAAIILFIIGLALLITLIALFRS